MLGRLDPGEGLRDGEDRRPPTVVPSDSEPRESNINQILFINYNEKIPGEDTLGREGMATAEATGLRAAFVDAVLRAEDAICRVTGGFCFLAAGFTRGFAILDTSSPS